MAMTDLDKATYLDEHIGQHIHFYHLLNGDSTAKIISVNPGKRTFEYLCGDPTNALTMSFDEIAEFEFRNKGIPPPMWR